MDASSTLKLVASLPAGEEIFDIHPPVDIPYPWGLWLVYLLVVMIAVLAVHYFLNLLAEKRREALLAPPPPPDPFDVAMKALRKLKNSKIWKNQSVKDICEQLALILREFLKAKHGLGIGKASTSDELIEDLYRKKIVYNLVKEIEILSERLDGVKYAGKTLSDSTPDSLFEKVSELISCRSWNS
ncbi:MAG: hypothetical protein HQM10_24090 [Candidatus Riflebacteria bacterium]|nr:hypothetical protein [Candidatus Riflebacteria bacterium]